MTTDIDVALDEFLLAWCAFQTENDHALQIEYDKDWPSAAVDTNVTHGEWAKWTPKRQTQNNDLSALTQGLEIMPNPQLQTFFTRYWSDNLAAQTPRGQLQLLQAWNPDDFVRLQENLIAHVLMKRRLGQRDTLFFAVTDDDDFILSVLNETGEVVLEQVGQEPIEVLAPDLASFISALHPAAYQF